MITKELCKGYLIKTSRNKDLNDFMDKKTKKIWGVSYGILGDLIMGLPVLTYWEKKYPGSYKYWVLEKSCGYSEPIFGNHPLINERIVRRSRTDLTEKELKIFNSCDIKAPRNQIHDDKYWYNYRNGVEETARLAGIYDIKEVLSEEEMKPRLYKWFDIKPVRNDIISIWPFAKNMREKRSPSVEWWKKLINKLIDKGFIIYQFGRSDEPVLGIGGCVFYLNFTQLTFFEQIKKALSSKLSIVTDSGSGWVMGAYQHSSICLLTNWLNNHNQNFLALAPINDNGVNLFVEGGCDNIKIDDVIKEVLKKHRIR